MVGDHNRLRPFYDKTSDFSNSNRKEDLEEEEYVVESIQAHRVRYGKTEYLVKWKGYAVHEMTRGCFHRLRLATPGCSASVTQL